MSEQTLIKEVTRLEKQRAALQSQQRGDVLDQEIEQANEALAAKQKQLFDVKLAAAQKQLDKFRRGDEIPLFDRLAKIGGELEKLKQDAENSIVVVDDLARPVRSGDPMFGRSTVDIVGGVAFMADRMHAQIENTVKGHKIRRKSLKGYGR